MESNNINLTMATPLRYKIRKYRLQLIIFGIFLLFLYSLDTQMVSDEFAIDVEVPAMEQPLNVPVRAEKHRYRPHIRPDVRPDAPVVPFGAVNDLVENEVPLRSGGSSKESSKGPSKGSSKSSSMESKDSYKHSKGPSKASSQGSAGKPPADSLASSRESDDDDDWQFIISGAGNARFPGTGDKTPLKPYTYPRKEKFPAEKVIPLPAPGKAALPKIQATKFSPESDSAMTTRLRRREKVKEVFKVSYDQYKSKAWGHDEIRPVSEDDIDPFLGWAATMVDALDTMHIMGLSDDFKEAVQYVSEINFRSTYRPAIPLFETVIRYLGGLIAAYDLSGGTEQILLDKATELGDNLLGAFDTPNRMPMVFYNWQDKDVKTKWRAGTDTSFAELGSLSVEFTRLAQLSGQSKYYDAIARITDAVAEFASHSDISGLMPQVLDVSGCNVSTTGKLHSSPKNNIAVNPDPIGAVDAGNGSRITFPRPLHPKPDEAYQPSPGSLLAAPKTDRETETESETETELEKRAVITPGSQQGSSDQSPIEDQYPLVDVPEDMSKYDKVVMNGHEGYCIPQGMRTGLNYRRAVYTMGGLTDSGYEYFMKEYQLLKGGEEKYIPLYENMVAAAKENLVFKPWVENNKDILFVGSKKLSLSGETEDNEMTHLSCFTGGMFALGGRILGRPEDVELGKKITEGCVWAYNRTRTGVMPETFYVRRCPQGQEDDCEFDLEKVLAYDELHRPVPAMPTQIPIDDGEGGMRWGVSRMWDMPRSFLQGDPRYLLRPEAIESVFYMYRITGDSMWQEKGWKMFESILKVAQVVDPKTNDVRGYSAVLDVTNPKSKLDNSAESFWLAETLKYFYLLFEDPSVISLDDYVFNTEAHPFRLA